MHFLAFRQLFCDRLVWYMSVEDLAAALHTRNGLTVLMLVTRRWGDMIKNMTCIFTLYSSHVDTKFDKP